MSICFPTQPRSPSCMRFFSLYGCCSVAVLAKAPMETGVIVGGVDGGFFVGDLPPELKWSDWWLYYPPVGVPAEHLSATSPTVHGGWEFPLLGRPHMDEHDYEAGVSGRIRPHSGVRKPMWKPAFIEIEGNPFHLELIEYSSPPDANDTLDAFFGVEILPAAVFMFMHINNYNPNTLESASMNIGSDRGSTANSRSCLCFSIMLHAMGFRFLNGQYMHTNREAKDICVAIAKQCDDNPTECTVKGTRAYGSTISLPILTDKAVHEMKFSRYIQTTVNRP